MENLLILGAGQFGQVTKEIAESLNIFDKIYFLDDNSEIAIGKMMDYTRFAGEYQRAIVAIGNPELRKEWLQKLKELYRIDSIISPRAYISKSAIIGEGNIMEPASFVNSNTIIGDGCILCAGSIINHNSIIGDYCHLNCGSIVKSNSKVENGTKVDYGEIV